MKIGDMVFDLRDVCRHWGIINERIIWGQRWVYSYQVVGESRSGRSVGYANSSDLFLLPVGCIPIIKEKNE